MIAIVIAATSSLVLVSGCDSLRDVEVTNGCAEPIEVKDAAAPLEIVPTELAPGESATVSGSDGPIALGVGAPGSSADEVLIKWEDMQQTGDKSARAVTVEGDNCPGQQS